MLKIPGSLRQLGVFTLLLFLASSFTACFNPKQAVYLHGLPDSTRLVLPDAQVPTSLIQPDDILEIKFTGKNQQLVDDFNSKGGGFGTIGGAGANLAANYLVDADGYISIYMLGKVKATGYTKDQLQEQLKSAASKYLLEASVNVRFVNFRFTVLGEVRTPSNFAVSNEKVSILEALAYAGDMTSFSRRDAVRVIRDSSGKREIGTVNLTDKSLFTSQYYYLRRNDVVYVETQIKQKQATETLTRTASVIGIISSLVTLSYLLFSK